MSKKIAIISDFDGTISTRDIGHHFFGTYIPDEKRWLETLDQWKMGLISSKECLERELEMSQATKEDLDIFISNEKLDPYFKDFVDFCKRRNYELLVVSDGLDYYIEWLLLQNGLGTISFYANHLVLKDGILDSVEFPYYNRLDCDLCGNCKKYHVEDMRKKGFYVIYIGNGLSDRCPCEFADLVFAKGELMEHCKQEGIDFIEYRNFRDIERELARRFIYMD